MKRIRHFFLLGAAGAIGMLANSAITFGEAPRAMGWAENVRIVPENLTLKAKLDTGAQTTSIDAPHFTLFEQGGRPWVRFRLSDRAGNAVDIERPVVRVVKVKRSDLETLARPVVMLALCLGGQFREEAVTLSNRSHLRYPLLIGRSTMTGRFVVDSSRRYTFNGKCIGQR